MDKKPLRAALEAKRAALSAEMRAQIERTVLSRLLDLPAWQNAPIICGYTPARGELDLLPVWQAAVAAGKTFALPVTVTGATEGRMIFRATPNFCPERLVRARFGIAEPPDDPDFPVLSHRDLQGALMIVPGLGFDREGYRVGYGGGYYDRYLAALDAAGASVFTVGLCPAACRVDRLPREAHDRAVHLVIDEISSMTRLDPKTRERSPVL